MAAPTKPAAKPSPGLTLGTMNVPTQIGIIVGMVVVLLAMYYLLLYTPLAEEAGRETARRATVAQQLVTAQHDLQRYNDDVAELERSRSHSRELQRILPNTADIPGFMRSINTLAESSGLSITLIQPDQERVEQYFVRVPVRLEVTGSYLALARFFRAVSQLPRVINMENITLVDPGIENGEVKLKARVLATTFRALTPTDVQPAARPGTAARPGAAPGGRR